MAEHRELCCLCQQETGRAGPMDDSIFISTTNGELGPLCETCLDDIRKFILEDSGITAENAALKAELAQYKEALKVLAKRIWRYDPTLRDMAMERALAEAAKRLEGKESAGD